VNLSQLRAHINSNYLSNDIISGREAKNLVRLVAKDGLTQVGQSQLETLKAEFADKFSDAGMRDFERAFSRAVDNSPTLGGGDVGDGQSALDVRAGVNLENLPTAFRLSEVKDPDVKKALRRIDLNLDGNVDDKDMRSAGFSEQQFRMYIFTATLMGAEIQYDADAPQDLTGKKVLFTGIGDKTKENAWAEAMGAEIVTKMDENVDFLFVGNSAGTGKDERAHILNTLGLADIQVIPHGKFLISANAAGVTGPAPDPLTDAEFRAARSELCMGWLKDWLTEGYEDDIADEPHRETELRAALEEELRYADYEIEPNEYWFDSVEDDYAAGNGYRDNDGRLIPLDDLEIFDMSFGSDRAGIILSVAMVMDRRTGRLLDQGDIQD
jgi:hypothetical protein